MLRIKWHLDAPGKAGARHTQVIKPLLNESNHLILAAFGLDKVRMVFIEL